MKRTTSLLILGALFGLTLSTGCLLGEEEEGNNGGGWKPPVEEKQRAKLSGKYVSGHLGNYDGCPDQAYAGETSSGSSTGASRGATAGDVCDGPGCGGNGFAPSCDGAQVSLDLENSGLGDGEAIAIQKILLLDESNNELASLPLIEIQNIATMKDFDGKVAKNGNKKSLRVKFQGPRNPYSLRVKAAQPDGEGQDASEAPSVCAAPEPGGNSNRLAPGCGGGSRQYFKIKVIFSAQDHPDFSVESRSIYPMTDVAT